MKRLFAAIKITPDKAFLDQFLRLKDQLRQERIKWVEEYNIHITVKFFGETEEKRIPEIENVLNIVAGRHLAFGIWLENLGIFGSRYDPRVVWVGIKPYENLVLLMKDLQDELKTIGFVPDRQNLVPHLTLGRVKEIRDKQGFQKTIEYFRETSSTEIKVFSIILYESILKKEGPVYLPLSHYPLIKA